MSIPDNSVCAACPDDVYKERVLTLLSELSTKMNKLVGVDGNNGEWSVVKEDLQKLKSVRDFQRGRDSLRNVILGTLCTVVLALCGFGLNVWATLYKTVPESQQDLQKSVDAANTTAKAATTLANSVAEQLSVANDSAYQNEQNSVISRKSLVRRMQGNQAQAAKNSRDINDLQNDKQNKKR
jgi:hypothetical protein